MAWSWRYLVYAGGLGDLSWVQYAETLPGARAKAAAWKDEPPPSDELDRKYQIAIYELVEIVMDEKP